MVERIDGKVSAGVCFAAALLLSLLTFLMSEKTSTAFCASAVVFAVMGWISVACLCDDIRLQWQRGENACKEREDRINLVVSTFLTQEAVDAKLQQLATKAENMFRDQAQYHEGKERNIDDVTALLIARAVANAKSEFWSAHELAKSLGFKVRPKIRSYTKK